MDPVPLIPKQRKKNIRSDNSQLIRALFHKSLQDEVVSRQVVQNMQTTCKDNLHLKNKADSIHKIYEDFDSVMTNCSNLETTLIQHHALYLVKKDNIIRNKALHEMMKLKYYPLFKQLEPAAAKKYFLIQASDLLPAKHIQALDFQEEKDINGLGKYLQSSKESLPDIHSFLPSFSTSSRIPTALGKRERTSSKKLLRNRQVSRKYSTPKPHTTLIKETQICKQEPVTFIAIPNCVKFTKYRPGKKYEKVVHIQNISNKVGHFEFVPLKPGSKFEVWWDDMPGLTKMVAAGMSITVHISFLCDSLDEAEDEIIVNSEDGNHIFISLEAHHDAPVLKVKEFVGVPETKMSVCEYVLKQTLDCGMSLLGECVTTTISLINTGGKGQFFIMSEEDWNFASLRDISWDNILVIPPFWVTPAYFSLDSNEVMDLILQFQPETYGMHVACIYIACDNCCVLPMELLGDGCFYEKNFIEFTRMEKLFRVDMEDDDSAKYCLNIGNVVTNSPAQQSFSLQNTSEIHLDYYWVKRKAEIDAVTPNVLLNLPEDALNINPTTGRIEPNSSEYFVVECCVADGPFGAYRLIMQLFVLNIPKLSIVEESEVMKVIPINDSLNRVDVLVGEVELWVQHISILVTLKPWIFKFVGGKLSCEDPALTCHFQFVNSSTKKLEFCWLVKSQHDNEDLICSLKVEPATGCMLCGITDFVLTLVAHKPGIIAEKLRCLLNDGEISMDLLVGAEVADPVVKPSTFSLDLGVVEQGTIVTAPLILQNTSHLGVGWTVQEYVYDFEMSTLYKMDICHLSSDAGYLCHKGSLCELVYTLDTKKSDIWLSIMEVCVFCGLGTGAGFNHQYIMVLADIKMPQLSLVAPQKHNAILAPWSPLHIGILRKATVILRNYSYLHISYKWGAAVGLDTPKLQVSILPQTGSVSPAGEINVTVSIVPLEEGLVKEFYIPCFVGRMVEPCLLNIVCWVDNLNITFCLPMDNTAISMSDLQSYSSTHLPWGVQQQTIDRLPTTNTFIVESSLNIRDDEKKVCTGHPIPLTKEISQLPRPHKNVNNKMNLYQVPQFELINEENLCNTGRNEIYINSENKNDIDDNDKAISKSPVNRSVREKKRSSQRILLEHKSVTSHSVGMDKIVDKKSRERFTLSFAGSEEVMLKSTSKESLKSMESLQFKDDNFEVLSNESHFHTYELVDKLKATSKEEISIEADINEKCHPPVFENISARSISSSNHFESECVSQLSLGTYFSNVITELIIPYSEIKLKELECYQAVKTTFMVRNETPINTRISLSVTNFPAKEILSQPNIIQEALSEVQGRRKDEWRDRVRDGFGIVVQVEPSTAVLTDHEPVLVDVWVYATTWGIYTEIITCEVEGLQPFMIKLIAEVIGYPISFPITEEMNFQYPILRFGSLHSNREKLTKSVIMQNSSCLTLSIVWHVFLIEPSLASDIPFNLVLDMFTPLSFEQTIVPDIKKQEQCRSVSKIIETVCPICYLTKERKLDTLMEINLISNPGTENYKYFQVKPAESILQPWEKTTVQVTITTAPELGCVKAMLLGFIRVSPIDKYYPMKYLRLSGHNLCPVRVDLCADVVKPLLSLNLVKGDLKFKMYAVHIASSPFGEYTLSRVFVLRNTSRVSLTISVKVDKPFYVTRMDTSEYHYSSGNDIVMVKHGECAEVEIACTVTKDAVTAFYKEMYKTYPNISICQLAEKIFTIEKNLSIIQGNLLVQSIILELTIIFPIVKASYKSIDFGPVYVEDTKWLVLDIENLTATRLWFRLTKVEDSPEFRMQPTCGVLPPATVRGQRTLKILVFFTPKESKTYNEVLRIHTCIPDDFQEISLSGVGTLNEKYKPSAY